MPQPLLSDRREITSGFLNPFWTPLCGPLRVLRSLRLSFRGNSGQTVAALLMSGDGRARIPKLFFAHH